MSDNMTATPTQKKELTIQALEIEGFEEMPAPGIFAKQHGKAKILVDLNEKQPSAIFIIDGKRNANDDVDETLVKTNQIIVDAETGQMPSRNKPDIVVNTKTQDGTPEQPDKPIDQETAQHIEDTKTLSDDDPAKVTAEMVTVPHALPPSVPSDLSVSTIKKYINNKATDEEAYVFLQLCKARGLNPFLKEAYLIKYDHVSPATMVVGKDAFMKRAELHPKYDGFEAGIIVEYKDSSGFVIVDENRVGTFLREEETLLGGWAKVYRKDHTRPVEITVSMKEFNTGKSSWKKIPATMIRKVALVQGHREAFPSELSGMYDQSEMGVEVIT